ncbi:tetratricopeptide repeat protein [Pseudodesulfovibrio indicus]|uniref:tetratricopeptide repeat protein n=1 Tax=Pseudodesulfovibrio indicus TaxID=1716143 RepID=UPI00292E74B2|nr:tetratricopeptide repeat protein [Pseudodesulfovibrio indicus]
MTDTSETRTPEEILALVREVEQEAPGGAETLFMAAMLADASLPYDFALSVDGTPHNPALINPAAAFFAATAIMDPIIERGLALADADNQVFILAPGVRETLRTSLTREQALEWGGRAVYALNLVLPDADPQHWPMVEWLMPHILACRDLAVDPGVVTAAANRVLHQAGFSLHFQQRHQEGAVLLEAALDADIRAKGERHPDITADLEGLGTVYWAAGDLARAETAFRDCLALQREIFTENNPASAPILNSLAMVLQAAGRNDEAEKTLRDCLDLLRAAGAERHPATASCLNNLALVLEGAGRTRDALGAALQSLELNGSLYGELHPDTASGHNVVALLLDGVGDGAGAEDHFRKSLAIRERLYGTDHPETAQAECNLALFLASAHRKEEAFDHFERGFSAYEYSLGPDHPYMETALAGMIEFLEQAAAADSPLGERARTRLKAIVQRAG